MLESGEHSRQNFKAISVGCGGGAESTLARARMQVQGHLCVGDPPSRTVPSPWRDSPFKHGGGSKYWEEEKEETPELHPRRRWQQAETGIFACLANCVDVWANYHPISMLFLPPVAKLGTIIVES